MRYRRVASGACAAAGPNNRLELASTINSHETPQPVNDFPQNWHRDFFTGPVLDVVRKLFPPAVTAAEVEFIHKRLSDPSGLLGRSLMPPGAAGLPRRPDTFLVQSSYSRVFGLLDGHGEWMYTADVNREKEDFYDLAGNSSYPKALVPANRLKYRKRLLERMEEVNRFYGRRR